MATQLTNLVIAKNEHKNLIVKTFKKPKKLKNLNIQSLKIIETKQIMCDYTKKKNIYIYIYIYREREREREREKDELPSKE